MKTKKQFNFYSFYDLSGMSRHLEIMAAKGWFPRKLGTFLWQYEQGEPAELTYDVCYCGEAAAYTPEKGRKEMTFRENAEKKGWSLAASSQRIQVYSTEKKDPAPVSDSPYDRITGVSQAAKPGIFLYGTMIVLAIFSILVLGLRMNMSPVGVLSDSFGLAIGAVLSILAVYYVLDMILYFRWKSRAEIAATSNEYEVTGTQSQRAVKTGLVVAALLAGMVLFFSGGSPLVKTFVSYLAGILVLMLILTVVRIQLLKKGLSPKKARTYTRTINVIVAIVLVGGITLSLNQMQRQDRGTDGEMPVTVQKLFQDIGGREVFDHARSKETFLICYSEAFQSAQAEDGSPETLISYEIVDSKMVPVDSFVLDYYLHRTESVAMQEDGTPIFLYREMDPALWGAEKAWRMYREEEAQNVYLILYGDRLIELGAAWALTEQQMRICMENFAQ